MAKWASVFKERLEHRAQIVRDVLEDAEVPAVIINKRDYAYQIGYFEVQVEQDDVLKALKIIQDDIHFE